MVLEFYFMPHEIPSQASPSPSSELDVLGGFSLAARSGQAELEEHRLATKKIRAAVQAFAIMMHVESAAFDQAWTKEFTTYTYGRVFRKEYTHMSVERHRVWVLRLDTDYDGQSLALPALRSAYTNELESARKRAIVVTRTGDLRWASHPEFYNESSDPYGWRLDDCLPESCLPVGNPEAIEQDLQVAIQAYTAGKKRLL